MAIRTHKPRRSTPKTKSTPAEKAEQKRWRKKNKVKLDKDREKYERRNAAELKRRRATKYK